MAKDFADINRIEAEAGLQAPGAEVTTSTKQDITSRFVAMWEKKNAQRALRGGAVSTMALTLAACGDDDDDPTPSESTTPTAQTFTLTTDADDTTEMEPTGESDTAGDVFNAPLDVGIDGLVGVQTLQEADVIVGTDEVDVLNGTLNGTGAGGVYAAPSITDVEVLNLTSTGSVLGEAGLDLSNSTGYTQIWNIGSDEPLTVRGVDEVAAIGLDDVSGDDRDGVQNFYDVTYTSSADTTVQDVIATAVGTSEATGPASLRITAPDGIETLNLAVSDTVRLDLDDQTDEMETFNITGSGVTALAGDDQFPNLVALDASGYTGDLALDVSGSADLESVLTEDGDDVITIDNGVADGDLSVNLAGGFDILEVNGSVLDADDISALDFTGGISGVENLAFGDPVDIDELGQGVATLDLDGVTGDLETVWFFEGVADSDSGTVDGLEIANSPISDLAINAFDVSDPDDDAGFEVAGTLGADESVRSLAINSVGQLTVGNVDAGALQSLSLDQSYGDDGTVDDIGDLSLTIDSGVDNDVSSLETISAQAEGASTVSLDADTGRDDDADMDALRSVSVGSDEDSDLTMVGRTPVQQTQSFTLQFGAINTPGEYVFEYVDATGNDQQVTVPYTDLAIGDITAAKDIAAAFSALDEFDASTTVTATDVSVTLARTVAGTFPEVNVVSVTGDRSITNDGIQTSGVEGAGFEAVEDVVLTAADNASVDLDDVYGAFDTDVTAENDAAVVITNTNTESVSVQVGSNVEINENGTPNDRTDDSFSSIDVADLTLDGALHGNPNLATLEVSGAQADVTLVDDLSSMSMIDLTAVEEQFEVDASGAEYAEDSNVFYMIGGTSSVIPNQDGDSSLTLGDSSVVSVREVVSFTEADFGTIVIENFEAASADPNETDRIDLSDLGFTNEGQLDFEQGSYDNNGVFTSGNSATDDDYRITDASLNDSAEMGGEIIVTGVGDGNVDDLQANIAYV